MLRLRRRGRRVVCLLGYISSFNFFRQRKSCDGDVNMSWVRCTSANLSRTCQGPQSNGSHAPQSRHEDCHDRQLGERSHPTHHDQRGKPFSLSNPHQSKRRWLDRSNGDLLVRTNHAGLISTKVIMKRIEKSLAHVSKVFLKMTVCWCVL